MINIECGGGRIGYGAAAALLFQEGVERSGRREDV